MDSWEQFDRHYQDVYRFAYRMLGNCDSAKDIAQEALLRMARNRSKRLEGESARRWLFVVARNLCLNRLRRAARHPEVPLDACPEARSKGPNPAESAAASERSMLIKDAIAQLPAAMREVVVLREYEDLDYARIAEIIGCSLGTVKSRLARAREELRKRLQPLLEEMR